jgi:hypothetical protein
MPGYPPTTASTVRWRCQRLMEIAERARSYPMEIWLQPDAEGRTLKERYAEVAGLTYQLRDEVRRHWSDLTDPPAVAAGAHGDRRRRPVAVLLTEIGHCLGTAHNHLLNASQIALVPDSMHELMERIETLLRPETAPDPPAR